MSEYKSELVREILYELKEGLGINCLNPETYEKDGIEVTFDLQNFMATFLANDFDKAFIITLCLYKISKELDKKHKVRTIRDLKKFYDNLD